MTAKLFISHSSQDDPFVRELRQTLADHGQPGWIDSRELRGGDLLWREIKKAIESLFKVKVLKVNTITLPAKVRRFGASQSQGSNWKKAVATLKAGDKIELFEGA